MGLKNWSTLEELREQIIAENSTVVTARTLRKRFEKFRDYEIEFAEDRCSIVEENLNFTDYADALSTEGFKLSQCKETGSNKTESELPSHLDSIANYILYSKYDNLEQKQEVEKVQDKLKELAKTKNRDSTKKERWKLKKALEKKRMHSQMRDSKSNYREISLQSVVSQDGEEDMAREDLVGSRDLVRVYYTWGDKELNQNGKFKNSEVYWEFYSHHNPPISSIFPQLENNEGYGITAFKIINELDEESAFMRSKIEELPTIYKDKTTKKLVSARKKGLQNVNENRNLATKELRKPTILKSKLISDSGMKDDGIFGDVSYNNAEFVKAVLYNYSTINKKKSVKVESYLWAILVDFKIALNELVKNNMLSKTQINILTYILENEEFTYGDLSDHLLHKESKEYKDTNINYHINIIIEKIRKEMRD